MLRIGTLALERLAAFEESRAQIDLGNAFWNREIKFEKTLLDKNSC